MATRSTEKANPLTRRASAPAPARVAPGRRTPRLDPELAGEVLAGGWDHRWEIAPGVWTPCADPGARAADWTLERMLERQARDALVMSDDPTVLDLACGEGLLLHRVVGWGAHRGLGIEGDSARLHRARLLRDHFALGERQVRLQAALTPADREELFDVVLLTGIRDLLGDEAALLAAAGALTRGVCAIEVRPGSADPVARAALAASFGWVKRVTPPLHASPRYLLGQRELLLAGPAGSETA